MCLNITRIKPYKFLMSYVFAIKGNYACLDKIPAPDAGISPRQDESGII